jgi:hypothetical protein
MNAWTQLRAVLLLPGMVTVACAIRHILATIHGDNARKIIPKGNRPSASTS